MPFLSRLLQRFEAAMTASAFAEEGEVETARQMLGEDAAGRRRVAPRKRAGVPSRPAQRVRLPLTLVRRETA
jgi:hypothetical protein